MTIGFNPKVYQTMIQNFSKTLTYTPITKTTDGITGDETITPGTSTEIQGAFFKRDQIYNQAFEGLFLDAPAIILVLPGIELTKNGFIEYDGEKFQINDDPFKRLHGTTHYYNVARLYLYDRS